MSTYYDIRTKATIKDVSLSNELQVETSDNENHCHIRDKYNNILSCILDDDGRIINVKRYGGNDPTYILYKLVVEFDSLILVESVVHDLMHEAIKMPDDIYFLNYGNNWEEFTCSLLNHVNESDYPERYDSERATQRLVEISNKINDHRPVRFLFKEDIENYDQDYYVFCSNTTINDIARNPGILIEKDNMEDNIYWIKDRYDCVIECHVQNSGVIDYMIPHEQSAWYVLYTMATEHSTLFMGKEVYEKVIHYAIEKGKNESGGYVYDIDAVYRQYTCSFTNFVKSKGLKQEFKSC